MNSDKSCRIESPRRALAGFGATAVLYVPETGWRPAPALLVGALVLCSAPVAALGAVWLYLRLAGIGEGVIDPGALERQATVGDALYFAVLDGTIVVLALIAAGRFKSRPKRVLALGPPAEGARAYAAAILLSTAAAIVWIGGLWAIAPDVFAAEAAPYQARLKGEAGWMPLLALGLLAPLAEELFFRGFLFSALASSRAGVWGAALATTLVWTGLHVDHSAVAKAQVFASGLFLSWLLIRTGSLRVPIVCHVLFNCGVSLALLLTPPPG